MDRKSSSSRRPRVVSIPIHFIQSEQTQSSSALKIQKALRGFLVRKSVKQIKTILREVEEIERRIEAVKVIGRIDEKERLRLNETLMSLLLKLDSVRGICNGVRDCRKRVIKKAIALQEKVDSISTATETIAVPEILSDEDRVKVDPAADASDFEPDPEEVATKEALITIESVDDTAAAADFEPDPEEVATKEALKTIEAVDDTAAAADFEPDPEEVAAKEALKSIESVDDTGASGTLPEQDQVVSKEEKKTTSLKENVDSSDSVTAIASDDQVTMEEEEEEEEEPKTIHCLVEEDGSLPERNSRSDDGTNPEEMETETERERKRRSEYLLERMVEENEKVVAMMKELNEKNEIQMRLLNSLAQRVEMLEKTVVCDKLARMKKKKRHGGGGNNNF